MQPIHLSRIPVTPIYTHILSLCLYAQKPGDVVGTTGPDVLTTCGTPERLLSFVYEYMVGIGGACDPIIQWTPLQFYTESEIELLLELEEECAEDPSTCNGSGPSLLATATVTSVLLSLVSLLLALWPGNASVLRICSLFLLKMHLPFSRDTIHNTFWTLSWKSGPDHRPTCPSSPRFILLLIQRIYLQLLHL